MSIDMNSQFNNRADPVSASRASYRPRGIGQVPRSDQEVVLVVTRQGLTGPRLETRLRYDGRISTVMLPSGDERAYQGLAPVEAVRCDPDLHTAFGWEETDFSRLNPGILPMNDLLNLIRPIGDALSPSDWEQAGSPVFNSLDDWDRPWLFDDASKSWSSDHRISVDGGIVYAARLRAGDLAVVAAESIVAPERSWIEVLASSWIRDGGDLAGTDGFYAVHPGLLAWVCHSDAAFEFVMERVPEDADIVDMLRPRLDWLGSPALLRAHVVPGGGAPRESCDSAFCYLQTVLDGREFQRLVL